MANAVTNAIGTAAKKTYTVLKNLRHDGKGYAPGKAVQLTDKDAQILLKTRVVRPGAPPDAASAKTAASAAETANVAASTAAPAKTAASKAAPDKAEK